MITFGDFSRSFGYSDDPGNLDIGVTSDGYRVFCESAPLLTPGGHPFSHQSEGLIRMIITDLQESAGTRPNRLTAPVLFAYRRDIIEQSGDPFEMQWADLLAADPFVRIKSSGKTVSEPVGPDEPLFHLAFFTLSGLVGRINSFASRILGENNFDETEQQPFEAILRLSYSRLTADQKAVLQALESVHRAGLVLPLLLVIGEISEVEYFKGLISLRQMAAEQTEETLSGLARAKSYLLEAAVGRANSLPLASLIRQGEGGAIEFKSTLRWDIRAGKTNPAIERSCLKTISAFLNSSGGTLLIGIRDDGSVEGIETDKFANEDKFLLHLWTLIRMCLGREVSPYVRTRLEKQDGLTVCAVECSSSVRPVFLRQPGFPEEMFIRVGPSSNALDISEALKYIADRQKNTPQLHG
jgi:hypothetical protein